VSEVMLVDFYDIAFNKEEDLGMTVGLWEENLNSSVHELRQSRISFHYDNYQELFSRKSEPRKKCFTIKDVKIKINHGPQDAHEYAFYSHRAKERQKEAEKNLVESQLKELERYRKAFYA